MPCAAFSPPLDFCFLDEITGINAIIDSWRLSLSAFEDVDPVYQENEVTVLPKPISRISPVFPHQLGRNRYHGMVELEYVIDREGFVHSIRPLRMTHPDYYLASRNALMHWRYEPAMLDDEPVSVIARQVIDFSAGG